MIIKPLFTSALETALNQYLALDDNAQHLLTPLAGKIIAITLEPFDETLYLCPTADKIQCLENFVGEVDTRLTGTLPALGLMGFSANPMRSIHNGNVKISGDLEVGRKFQELFDKLDLQIEQKLSHVLGDTIAHGLEQFFRAGQQWTKDSLETFSLNTSEFLTEESRDLPAKAETELFYRQVDTLRMDYDRLAARMARLQSQLNKETE